MNIQWVRGNALHTCRLCDVGTVEVALLLTDAPGLPGITQYARCSACGSVFADRLIDADGLHSTFLSYYLEQGAGIDIMVEPLQRVTRARRFLEVGCGFGFALDFARQALRLDVVGVDSGDAAAAGAEVLGLPIHRCALNSDLQLGLFDLALASEVLEHVETPLQFLRDVRIRLTDDGLLRLTTPDAAVVHPDADPDALGRALSAGYHAVLFTHGALQAALERAGLSQIVWDSAPGTLRCWASPTEAGLKRLRPLADRDREVFAGYLQKRAGDFPADSAIALGLRHRRFKADVNSGRYAEAEASVTALQRSFEARHHIDLTEPERTAATLAGSQSGGFEQANVTTWPFCLASAFFFLGILELNGRRRVKEAEAAFTAAATIGERLLAGGRQMGIHDGEWKDLLGQARLHRLIPICRRSPNAALEELNELLASSRADDISALALTRCRAQLFMEAVHAGGFDAAAALESSVVEEIGELTDAVARANLLLALGLLAEDRGRTSEAIAWFGRASDATDASTSQDFRVLVQAKLTEATRAALSKVTGPPKPRKSAPRIAHGIDVFWCDAWGVYLSGWIHAYQWRIVEITLRSGEHERTLTTLRERADLVALFPDCPHVRSSGFAVYLDARPGERVHVRATLEDGTVIEMPLALPHGPLPAWPAERSEHPHLVLQNYLQDLPRDSRVLLVGARYSPAYHGEPHPVLRGITHLRVWGVDIHPGPGVDVVADVHRLASTFRSGSIDAVASSSLLEHLAAPWVAAAEINRVLRVGGTVHHDTPYTWPAHSEPNDFWRFSADGLRELFGPAMGFEILSAANFGRITMMPEPSWRTQYLNMPTVPAFGGAGIVARKVREIDEAAVAWPVGASDSARRARSYPVDGVARRDGAPAIEPKVAV